MKLFYPLFITQDFLAISSQISKKFIKKIKLKIMKTIFPKKGVTYQNGMLLMQKEKL